MMRNDKNIILTSTQVMQKVRRMAFEIAESHFGEPTIVIAGIDYMGYRLAKLLSEQLKMISPAEVVLAKLQLDKSVQQQSEVVLDIDLNLILNKPVIVVDDVLNTGRTIAYSLYPFFQMPIKRLDVAVLVDRSHHSFPIQPRYVGYELSTTIKQHIEVDLSEGANFGVYLY